MPCSGLRGHLHTLDIHLHNAYTLKLATKNLKLKEGKKTESNPRICGQLTQNEEGLGLPSWRDWLPESVIVLSPLQSPWKEWRPRENKTLQGVSGCFLSNVLSVSTSCRYVSTCLIFLTPREMLAHLFTALLPDQTDQVPMHWSLCNLLSVYFCFCDRILSNMTSSSSSVHHTERLPTLI